MKNTILIILVLLILGCKSDEKISVLVSEPAAFLKGIIENNDATVGSYFENNYEARIIECRKSKRNIGKEQLAFQFWLNNKVSVARPVKSSGSDKELQFPYQSKLEPIYFGIQDEIEINRFNMKIIVENISYEFVDSISSLKQDSISKISTLCLDQTLENGAEIKFYGINEIESKIINAMVYNDTAFHCLIADYNKEYDQTCKKSLKGYSLISKYIGLTPHHDGNGFNSTSNIYVRKINILSDGNDSYVIISYSISSQSGADVYLIKENNQFEKVKFVVGPTT